MSTPYIQMAVGYGLLERLHQLLILAVHILEHMSEDFTGRHREEVGLLRLRIGININLVQNSLLGIVAAHHRAVGERHGAGNLQ